MDFISDSCRRVYQDISARVPRSDDRFVGITAKHVQMPLREPFETAARRAAVSDTVVVEIMTESGMTGLGAATPVQYVTGETINTVIDAVNKASGVISGCQVSDFLQLVGRNGKLTSVLPDSPGAQAAVEIAMVDVVGKIAGWPSYKLFGGSPRQLETDITIPVVPTTRAIQLAEKFASIGFRVFKVKVGKEADEDFDRVTSIAQAVSNASFILDANQGFAPEDAVTFIKRLREQNLVVQVFEQPVDRSDVDGLAYVTKSIDVPVFADESVHKPEDVLTLHEAKAVRGVNIKLMKSGLFGALEIATVCKKLGLGLMLGCMLEPRVSISAAIHLAWAVPEFKHFDLDADLLLAAEGDGCFTRIGASLSAITAAGLGC